MVAALSDINFVARSSGAVARDHLSSYGKHYTLQCVSCYVPVDWCVRYSVALCFVVKHNV